jgi:hypothetical protein
MGTRTTESMSKGELGNVCEEGGEKEWVGETEMEMDKDVIHYALCLGEYCLRSSCIRLVRCNTRAFPVGFSLRFETLMLCDLIWLRHILPSRFFLVHI